MQNSSWPYFYLKHIPARNTEDKAARTACCVFQPGLVLRVVLALRNTTPTTKLTVDWIEADPKRQPHEIRCSVSISHLDRWFMFFNCCSKHRHKHKHKHQHQHPLSLSHSCLLDATQQADRPTKAEEDGKGDQVQSGKRPCTNGTWRHCFRVCLQCPA